jgi:hypothetical protein
LTRYFALFYTTGQVLTFLVQNFLTPVALRRLGLGRTCSGIPPPWRLARALRCSCPPW